MITNKTEREVLAEVISYDSIPIIEGKTKTEIGFPKRYPPIVHNKTLERILNIFSGEALKYKASETYNKVIRGDYN